MRRTGYCFRLNINGSLTSASPLLSVPSLSPPPVAFFIPCSPCTGGVLMFFTSLVPSSSIGSRLTAPQMLLQMCVWPSTWNLVNRYWTRCLRMSTMSWGMHGDGITGTVSFIGKWQYPSCLPQQPKQITVDLQVGSDICAEVTWWLASVSDQGRSRKAITCWISCRKKLLEEWPLLAPRCRPDRESTMWLWMACNWLCRPGWL